MYTIIDLFESSVARFADNTYLHEKQGDIWTETTYRATREQVITFAAGMLNLGLEYGDRVALLSEGRNAWIISELGMLYTGACSVPLSIKLSTAELKFRIDHSGAKMIVVSHSQFAKINEIRSGLKSVKQVILLDRESPRQDGDLYFDEILLEGEGFMKKKPEAVSAAMKAVNGDTLANITYTSGTTADPKGVMLTHSNYTVNVQQSLTLMDIPPTYRTLAILPWDHCFAHTACLYCFMAKGASVASVQTGKSSNETLKNIPKNINEIKPNLLMTVPALSKTFRKSIESGIAKKGKAAAALFKFGLRIAYAYNNLGYNRGKGWRIVLKPFYRLFDKILFSKVREGFGGELDFFIGGGALLDSELQRFFLAIGIPVCQGYGLSESSPVISSNSLKNIKIGTSGKLVKPLDLKILDDEGRELPKGVNGHIVIRGGNVMKGYWQNPVATAETIQDGWLHTGDLGYMDEDDYLVVNGRAKSLLIAGDGEK
ncbi:MAG: AMP-binding protein, partial [Lentimicrobiaceae bacterium]|nr:AMP-binding protein [Lentimicrobiaceae bacterium]